MMMEKCGGIYQLAFCLKRPTPLDVVYHKRGEQEPKSYVIHPYG